MNNLIKMLLFVAVIAGCSPHGEDGESGLAETAGIKTKQPGPGTTGAGNQSAVATAQLRSLADDIWSRTLEQSTYYRLMDGLPIERFEDLTLEQYHRDQAATASFRQQLAAIDPVALTGDDLITWEILDFQLKDDGANDDDFWLSFDITAYRAPYNFRFAQQALAAQSITDQAGADHYLALVGELADMIDHLITKVEGQTERGIYLPRPALPSTRATWDGFKASLPTTIAVTDERLQSLSGEERAAFSATLESLLESRVVGGFDRLLAAIGEDYEANAPESVGLAQYPGGKEVYRRLVRSHTTLPLNPEEIHERGKSAVADIAARMQALRV